MYICVWSAKLGFCDVLAREFGCSGTLSEEQLTSLERHFSLLLQWNRRMNLTTVQDTEEAVRLHYCESLFLGKSLPSGHLRIADIGSGAGFPGFPVAVLRPECQVDLIESNRRRAVFLREASRGIGNVRVVAARAESLRDRYDWIISRAVTPAEVLALQIAPMAAILMSERQVGLDSIKVDAVPWEKEHVLATFHVKQSADGRT
jgi:16S rRNA (guanine(527)-N(7))-methyltransferase RsmG